jgi:hypothetical protein
MRRLQSSQPQHEVVHDTQHPRSAILKKSRLDGPVLQVLGELGWSLRACSPVQRAATFDSSKVMEQMQKEAQ